MSGIDDLWYNNNFILKYIIDNQINKYPYTNVNGSDLLNTPGTDYAEYATKDVKGPKVVRFPSTNLKKLWNMGDSLITLGSKKSPTRVPAREAARSFINYSVWLDKNKTEPNKDDVKYMRDVSDLKQRNYIHTVFNRPDKVVELPKPKTPEQENILPWVTSTKTNQTSKVATMNPLLTAMAQRGADNIGQMSALDMARLREMSLARRQRYSKILRNATGSENASADMQRNNIGTATSALLSVLLGTGIGAGIGALTKNKGGAQTGALYGAGGGALFAGLGNVVGRLAGSISKTPHREALRDFSNIGISRYLVPGASEYHRARLNNALADMEEGVERPTQVIV